MAEPPPSPMPTTTGRGAGGRLASLPTPVKIGGVALIGAVGWILWKRHQASSSSAASSSASLPSTSAIDPSTGLPYAAEMGAGYGGSGLAPSLLGYNPTGQIIGYDSNGNPIYGVTPPSQTGTATPTNVGSTGSVSGGTTATSGTTGTTSPGATAASVPSNISSLVANALPSQGVALGPKNPTTGGYPAGSYLTPGTQVTRADGKTVTVLPQNSTAGPGTVYSYINGIPVLTSAPQGAWNS